MMPNSEATLRSTRPAVVVLNWNSTEDTIRAVQGLDPSHRRGVFVVDNGSTTGLPELEAFVRTEQLKLVTLPMNLGYAGGMNAGMRAARASGYSYAALVNADARPSAADLELMLERGRGAAVIGTAQASAAGRYVTAASGHRLFPKPFECGGCSVGVHDVDVVSGAVLIIQLPVAETLGWMDERYFHYAEEIDYCIRVRQAGLRVAWSCGTEVRHAVGGSLPHSAPGAHYYATRNKILLIRKHGANPWWAPRLWKDAVILFRRARRDRCVAAWRRGVADGFRGVTGQWQS